jgi:hypothetical protein
VEPEKMRIIFLIAILLPSIASASEWVELVKTPEARVMLDRASIETFDGGAKASLKFLYHKEQPGQTITQGRPFDHSINHYYLVCSTRQFQVLQLTVFHKTDTVGTYQSSLDLNNLIDASPGTGVMFLLDRLCPSQPPATR